MVDHGIRIRRTYETIPSGGTLVLTIRHSGVDVSENLPVLPSAVLQHIEAIALTVPVSMDILILLYYYGYSHARRIRLVPTPEAPVRSSIRDIGVLGIGRKGDT